MQQVRLRRGYGALPLLVGEAAGDAGAVLGLRSQDRQMAWRVPAGVAAKLDQGQARLGVSQKRRRKLARAVDRDRRTWKGCLGGRRGDAYSGSRLWLHPDEVLGEPR